MTSSVPEPVRRELNGLVRLAVPVVVVQLSLMSLGNVDTAMVGRLSDTALAAVALGHAYTMFALLFGFGVMMGLDPLVAQAWGAREHSAVGRYLSGAIATAVVLTVPFTAFMWFAEPLLRWMGTDPALVAPAADYCRQVSTGNLAFLLFCALRQTLQATGLVRPVVIAGIAANVFNVFANLGLVFGWFGLPALGVEGSAAATAMSRWVLLGTFVVVARDRLSGIAIANPVRDARATAPRLLGIGLPIAIQVSLEVGVFTVTAFLMGRLGELQMAAHSVTIQLAALVYMIPLGIGAAAATRVGNAVGEGDVDRARLCGRLALACGAGIMVLTGLAFLAVPELLARVFTDDRAVIGLAALLLPIAGWFAVFDGIQCVAGGILRGIADTRWPMVLALIGYWGLGLPAGLWLAFSRDLGPRGLWWGLTVGLGAAAVLLSLRLRRRFSGSITRA